MTVQSPDLFEKYMTESNNSPDAVFDRSSLSPNVFVTPREKMFCTENNLDQCVAYLNQVSLTIYILVC